MTDHSADCPHCARIFAKTGGLTMKPKVIHEIDRMILEGTRADLTGLGLSDDAILAMIAGDEPPKIIEVASPILRFLIEADAGDAVQPLELATEIVGAIEADDCLCTVTGDADHAMLTIVTPRPIEVRAAVRERLAVWVEDVSIVEQAPEDDA